MAGLVLRPVSESICHTFPNVPASPEEDEEKEIYCSSRGEGQFILDLYGGVFPMDQLTTVEGEGGGCGEGVYPLYYQ